MTSTAPERTTEDLAKLEDAFRSVVRRVCDPTLTMAGTRALKAESGELVKRMRAARKRAGLSVVGDGWLKDVMRGGPKP